MKNILLKISYSQCWNTANAKITVKVPLNNLSDATVLDIFDKLSFVELLYIADHNTRFRELIANKYDFNENWIDIRMTDSFGPHIQNLFGSFLDTNLTLKFLRNFGSKFSAVKLNYTQVNAQARLISAQINQYCSESLIVLEIITNTNFDVIAEWRKPFKQLSNLLLVGGSSNTNYDNIVPLNEILPSLYHLDLKNSTGFPDLTLFEHRFPNLKTFSFRVPPRKHNIRLFEKFLELNPQIQNLYVDNIKNLDFFRLFSEKLPQLEIFDFSLRGAETVESVHDKDNDKDGSKVKIYHFKNVKLCKLSVSLPVFLPIAFDGLIAMQIENAIINNDFMQFLTQQRNLEQLILRKNTFTMKQWLMLLKNMPKLATVEKYWDSCIVNDPLFALMQTKTSLKNIVMYGPTNCSNTDIWHKLVGPNWELNGEVQDSQISFARKERSF